jgi:CheY-like chemotaxis protein
MAMTTTQGGLPEGSACRVLVAEDSPTQEKIAVRLLENEGYSVEVAHNGKEAVDALERDEYDYVFMDVDMPVMDGLQATTVIRRREATTGQHTFVIAVTATATREECLAAGMDVYVSKPLTVSVLHRALSEAHGL